MLTQIIGVVAAAAFAVALSFAILWAIDKTIGLRVTPDEEREGLDTALHGEQGYEMGSTGAGEVHYEPAEPEAATTVARPLVAAR
jgi:ammonia channel protein AmtB